ncbi:NUDIX domain-containing protein [Henriciella barbarensis]|uniref:GDP-mannose pyrophosphatase n=1 Tax=Henriciella barbarensis TaxID=86342 RepID=A0A399QX48_9PROT|nr:NUDIX domain-containing protein [Henriciella barbarensis]RIJ23363.1 NUDIX domain-containing protein [Henriciella barbarensis]
MNEKPLKDRVTLVSSDVLADDWVPLVKHTIDYERRDGRRERLSREIYNRPDAAAVLPYDSARGTVLLIRQLRLPVFLKGDEEPMWEACAGVIEDEDPEQAISREAIEELGYQLHDLHLVTAMYASPASFGERVWCYTATYKPSDKVASGGGAKDEGEDIEVVELPFDDAYGRIETGDITDAKTILLLQHLKLSL